MSSGHSLCHQDTAYVVRTQQQLSEEKVDHSSVQYITADVVNT